jgi:UDP-N-acetylglucosamine acyltransferase
LSAAEIHPQALVSPGAELGSGVSVGPFAVIEDGVRVGDGTRIQASAYLCSGTTLGRDNVVHMGAVLGHEPQDRGYGGAPTRVVIGDRNIFREGSTVHRGTAPDTETRIGSDCFFMANSHAAHNCRVGDGVTLANGALLGGHVEVGDGAFLSGNAVVHQRIRVGRLAMIQGSSAASCDVPPFFNVVGLRRAGVEAHGIAAIRRAYRMLFHGRPNLGRARTRLAEELDRSDGWTPEVRELLEFLEGGQSFCSVRSRRSS